MAEEIVNIFKTNNILKDSIKISIIIYIISVIIIGIKIIIKRTRWKK